MSYWTKIEVYNHSHFIGSFYTSSTSREEIKNDINKEYGDGNWTKYNIGN